MVKPVTFYILGIFFSIQNKHMSFCILMETAGNISVKNHWFILLTLFSLCAVRKRKYLFTIRWIYAITGIPEDQRKQVKDYFLGDGGGG